LIAGTPIATLGQSIAAEARVRWLLARPPALSDGSLDVLARMAGDLHKCEWASRFNVAIVEIERAEVWLGVKCRNRL
jgi:hypothetical protein